MTFSDWAVAQVEREQAESDARERIGRLRPSDKRNGNSVSTVFTVRLDHQERVALEARADAMGIKPSVLARSFVRAGLTRPELGTTEALERIESAVAELRATVVRR